MPEVVIIVNTLFTSYGKCHLRDMCSLSFTFLYQAAVARSRW